MAPEFQSSFIPKEATTAQVFQKKKTGFIGMLAVLLLIVSLLASAGTYVYKRMLRSDIENLRTELAQAERAIDMAAINEMSEFAKKLNLAKTLVAKHQVSSNFISTLSSSTVKSIQFTEMEYNYNDKDGLKVSMGGKADSYASIALQENVFSQNENFKSIEFSDLSLSEKGLVSFSVDISLDPGLSIYSP